MKKLKISTAIAMCMILLSITVVFAAVNAVTPSTNDINRTNGWAHVDQISTGVGTTDLQFISTRPFASCFEVRTDGDTRQKTSETNHNPDITDGLYPYYCQNNSKDTVTVYAAEYVEVRMVFGGETDERFDWTRFEVIPKDQCKDGGWMNYSYPDGSPFKNPGLCIKFALTGK